MPIPKSRRTSLAAVLAIDLGLWVIIVGLLAFLHAGDSRRLQAEARIAAHRIVRLTACHGAHAPACHAGAPAPTHRA